MINFEGISKPVSEPLAKGINGGIEARAATTVDLLVAIEEARIATEASNRYNAEFQRRWEAPGVLPHKPITVQDVLARRMILATMV